MSPSTHFSIAEALVLAGPAGAGGTAPPTSTRIAARLKRDQGQISAVSVCHPSPARCGVGGCEWPASAHGSEIAKVTLDRHGF